MLKLGRETNMIAKRFEAFALSVLVLTATTAMSLAQNTSNPMLSGSGNG
jgi:hypothetical protein